MPEEQPLQNLTALKLVLETQGQVLVVVPDKIEHLGRRFHDRERRRLVVVDDDGNATCFGVCEYAAHQQSSSYGAPHRSG